MFQVTDSLCNRSCDACKFPQRVAADLMRLTEAEKLNRQSKAVSFIIARSAIQSYDLGSNMALCFLQTFSLMLSILLHNHRLFTYLLVVLLRRLLFGALTGACYCFKTSVLPMLARISLMQQKANSGAMTMTMMMHIQMTISLHRKVFIIFVFFPGDMSLLIAYCWVFAFFTVRAEITMLLERVLVIAAYLSI